MDGLGGACDMQSRSSDKQPYLRYMADSPEQIADSVDRTGLRGEITQAFQEAITRTRGSRQKSSEPAINKTREIDLKNGASSQVEPGQYGTREVRYGSSRNYN